MKIQRAPGVYIEWSDGVLTAKHANSHAKCVTAVPVVELLDRLTEPVEHRDVISGYPDNEAPDVEKVIDILISAGFIIDHDASGKEDVQGDESWWDDFGPEARAFHFATRDAEFVAFRSDEAERLAEELAAQGGPAPELAKSYPGSRAISLPAPFELDMPLAACLRNRRTHRAFRDEAVPLDALATVLYFSFAPLMYQSTGVFGPQMVKASPAAGSRHDTECYVACFDVGDVPAGLYHYNCQEHTLELLKEDFSRRAVLELTEWQDHCANSAFTCFVTTTPRRLTYKYRHPRAYRIWMYNVGHVGQTFDLVCTALGLGPFQTSAFQDRDLEKELGIDRRQEFVTYVLGAGVPVVTEEGLPPDMWPAPDPRHG